MADYAHGDKLVSTEWVREHLNDHTVRLIEIDVDTSAYEQGHIPGAIAWNWTLELQDQIQRDVPSQEAVQRLLRDGGVQSDTTVVLFGDNNNWFAAYALWMLEMYGVTNTKLMNGGRGKWLAEGKPTTNDVPMVTPGTITVSERDESIRAKAPDVLTHLGTGSPLIDVRSPDEFNGVIIAPPGLTETAQRKGHIPEAFNVPWGQAVAADGTFKPADELKQLYATNGVNGTKPVITYCRIGERSSHTWFALHHLLGYENVRNYDGSWTEWGSMVGMSIENPSATP